MQAEEAAGTADLLDRFIGAEDPDDAQRLLEGLVWGQAAPLIRDIAVHKIRSVSFSDRHADIEDVVSQVLTNLIVRLQVLRQDQQTGTVRDFRAYVAMAAYHGCDDYFRYRFPQRHRLKNRLRYLLTTDPRFALWQDPAGEWYCGRNAREFDARGQARTREAAALLVRLFDENGDPLILDDLVDRVVEHLGSDYRPSVLSSELTDGRGNPLAGLERREWLRSLWAQIGQLPVSQRVCLLLNLRDHQCGPAIALLPVTGVATLRNIAALLEMNAEELAALWKDLPLDDNAIAARLGVTRQQVINLRKSARARLVRNRGGRTGRFPAS